MPRINAKTIGLAVVILVLLAAVIIVAITLDQNNIVDNPENTHGNQTPSSTHSSPATVPSGTDGDMIEGSMGLGDNPFN